VISHRLRATVTAVPLLAVAVVLVVSPGFAADSLVISSKLSGSIVSGEIVVEGSIIGANVELVTLALAPQTLVDCGEPIAQSVVEADKNRFAGRLPTTMVPDGPYCLIAVADEGRLSAVVGGITVDNGVGRDDSIDGVQLPTQSLDVALSEPRTVGVLSLGCRTQPRRRILETCPMTFGETRFSR